MNMNPTLYSTNPLRLIWYILLTTVGTFVMLSPDHVSVNTDKVQITVHAVEIPIMDRRAINPSLIISEE